MVIDKLPFAAPDDPVQEARSDRLRQEGVKAVSIKQYTGLPFRPGYLVEQIKATMASFQKAGAAR